MQMTLWYHLHLCPSVSVLFHWFCSLRLLLQLSHAQRLIASDARISPSPLHLFLTSTFVKFYAGKNEHKT